MKKITLFILTLIIAFTSCVKNNMNIPENSEMYDFASPIYCNENGTEIYLNGYFKNVQLIDSVINQNYITELSFDKKRVKLPQSRLLLYLFSSRISS